MADILPFKKPAKKKVANKSLCRHGFQEPVYDLFTAAPEFILSSGRDFDCAV
ncbi:hypothetical protein ACRYJU_13585 [Alloalcanivorax xenomutans]|uniref:hypothetical protein n=1 Tax=Alloalcanivorax xenomutans TaxID=1094342 RepID=UPI001F4646BE|nr:hypothetical protein [Alloalcanivorax xenomutans]MCE7522269.1 hypothetical protein [Alloalcanivorax xenomutans]